MKEIESEKYIKQKLRDYMDFPLVDDKQRKALIRVPLDKLQKSFEDGYESATKWIDVKDRLPERGCDVLVVMQDVDGLTHTEIRWRSIHNDVVVDKNGFAIYPSEEEVLAWLPIPSYYKIKQ